MSADRLVAPVEQLRTAFDALLIAEVKAFGGVPIPAGRCAAEKIALREAIAALLDADALAAALSTPRYAKAMDLIHKYECDETYLTAAETLRAVKHELAALPTPAPEGEPVISANPATKEHSSAPVGYRCADCQIDSEACPRCYRVWWQRRHPNVTLIEPVSTPAPDLCKHEWEMNPMVGEPECRKCGSLSGPPPTEQQALANTISALSTPAPPRECPLCHAMVNGTVTCPEATRGRCPMVERANVTKAREIVDAYAPGELGLENRLVAEFDALSTPAPDLRETLAALCHDQWAGWMRYLFGKSETQATGGIYIPKEWFDRWQRQVNMSYADLREDEKNSDRKEADRILAACGLAAALSKGEK